MKKIMLIGFGAMAQAVIERLPGAWLSAGSWRVNLIMRRFTHSLVMQ